MLSLPCCPNHPPPLSDPLFTCAQVMAHRHRVDNLKEIFMAVQDPESKQAWIDALKEKVPTFEECLAEVLKG